MALQVWLPLNKEGDFQNRGLANITVTNNGATYNSSGKIGGCYTFGNGSTSSNGVNINNNFTDLGTTKSISVWVNPKGNHLHYTGTIISSGNWNSQCWVLGLDQDNSGINMYYRASVTTPIPLNTWTHICVTIDENTTTYYKNGEIVGTEAPYTWTSSASNTMIGRETYASGYFSFNGDISDVRIYDHCLSPKEVKEISKALVLHYPLNDAYVEGTTNLANQSYMGGWINSGSRTVNYNDTTLPNVPTSQRVYSMTATSDGSIAMTCGLTGTVASKTIVASVYVWLDGAQNGFGVYVRSNKTDDSVGYLQYNGTTNAAKWPTKQWIRIVSDAITMPSDATTVYLCTYLRVNTQYVAMNGWQIEENDHATPFTSSTRTATTVYDCSGYSNNGTIKGSLSCVDDSPRYNVSTYFSANTNQIVLPSINYSGFGNSYTISWWAKGNPNMMWGFADGNRLNIPFVGCYANTGDSYNNPFYTPGTTTTITSPLSTTEFKYYVAVGDGSTLKLYVNGVHYGTAKTYKALTGTQIYINGWSSASSYAGVEYISDFRIYATALSADDVKELYNTSAIVCNNGAMLAYELDTSNITASSVTEKGILSTGTLTEDSDTLTVVEGGIVQSSEFIEI